jgi:glycosyltransferase 2 family protein
MLVLAALASVLIVVLIAYRTRGVTFRWELLLAAIEQADLRWLGASICLNLLSIPVRAVRWEIMLRPLAERPGARAIGLRRLTSDTAIGLTAGLLLGRVGEAVRPYLIAVQTGLPFASQAAAWMLERILDLLAVLLLCGFALVRVPLENLAPNTRAALAAGGYSLASAGAICLVVLFAFRDPAQRAKERILSAVTFLSEREQRRIARMLDSFSEGVASTREPKTLTLLLVYTLVEWGIIVGASLAMLHAFQATRSLGTLDVLALLAFMTIGSLVQVPGVGGGVQAALIVTLKGIYGVPVETAAGIALAFWAGSFAVVPVGLACTFQEGLNWGKLKSLSTKQILDDPET